MRRATYTPAEHAAMAQFEAEEVPKGLISSDANANALIDYLGDTPLTMASIRAAVDAHVTAGWKMYSSPQQQAYETALKIYCPNQHSVDLFLDWFSRMGKHCIVDLNTDDGLANAATLLRGTQGKEFTVAQLNLEMSRAFARGHLHVEAKGSGVRYSPHSGGSRTWDAPESTMAFTGGKSYRNLPPTPGTIEASGKNADNYWQNQCEGIGGTHSQRASLAKMFVRKSDGSGIDWQATHQKRLQIARNS